MQVCTPCRQPRQHPTTQAEQQIHRKYSSAQNAVLNLSPPTGNFTTTTVYSELHFICASAVYIADVKTAHPRCEQLAQGCYSTARHLELELATSESLSFSYNKSKQYRWAKPDHKVEKFTMLRSVLFDTWTLHVVYLLHADTFHVLTTTAVNVTVLIHSCSKRIIFPLFLHSTRKLTAVFIHNKYKQDINNSLYHKYILSNRVLLVCELQRIVIFCKSRSAKVKTTDIKLDTEVGAQNSIFTKSNANDDYNAIK